MKRKIFFTSAILFLLTAMFVLTSCGGGGGGGGYLPGPTAKPGAFTLISPGDGDTASLTPTLSWTASSQAANYRVQLDVISNPTFSGTLLLDQMVKGTHYNIASSLTNSTQYIWRVIANNSKGTSLATAGTNSFFTFTAKDSGGVEWAVVSNPTGFDAEIFSAASDTNYVYLAGYNETASICDYGYQCRQWRIEKRQSSNGALVPAFGSGGVVTTASTSDFDYISKIAIDDALYAVGIDINEGWRIEKRNLSSGQLISSFGIGGKIYSTPTFSFDTAVAAAKGPDSLYIVGYSSDSSFDNEVWRIEKRSAATGVIDPDFNVISSTTGSGFNEAMAIATDSIFLYILGFETSGGNEQWRIDKRSVSDGSLASFGTVTFNQAPLTTYAYSGSAAIAIDSQNMYIAVTGYDSGLGMANTQWRLEKRSLLDGSLDGTFGGGSGVIIFNPGGGYDSPTSILIDGSYMYVAGYDSNTSGHWFEWRIEKRSLSTGALDTSFGNGGVITIDPANPGDDGAWALTIDPANPSIYIAGYDSAPGNREWRIEKRSK